MPTFADTSEIRKTVLKIDKDVKNGVNEKKLKKKYKEFEKKYPRLFMLIVDGIDLKKLDSVFSMMEDVRNNKKSYDQAQEEYEEKISYDFIPKHIVDEAVKKREELKKEKNEEQKN